ncbi:hypothetical protein C8D87_104190 [Lentzea atacamensis]|uniref:Uncharacterized protein n=2 Tax=Lentzea atacamensis TaxID=531938 RepID=A0ABX9EA53_9PSEU|nr:hypothetical protein C8D87_104190 [Lentzea atacamensis]
MQNLRETFGDDEEAIRRIVRFRINRLMTNAKVTKHPQVAVRLRKRAQQYMNAIGDL